MASARCFVFMFALAGLPFGGCAKDSCEVDTSGPECTQTFALELPSCPETAVTLDSFYDRIINANCATASCHGGPVFPTYGPNSPQIFLDQVLHRSPSRMAMPLLKYVRPRNVDNSFLLYKVVQSPTTGMTQQDKIQIGGDPMPRGQAPLSAEDQCILINWVRSGAN